MLTTEVVLVKRTLCDLHFDLSGYPEIEVLGHRMQESGYELLLEGDEGSINELVMEWQEMKVLVFEEEEASEWRTHSRVGSVADTVPAHQYAHRSGLVA